VRASASVIVMLWASNLAAQEKELTAGDPVRVEDAVYVAAGDGSLLATAGFERPSHEETQASWHLTCNTVPSHGPD
jgi:hypothetical protein